MKAINISNDKARNAQVGFDIKRRKSDINMVRKDGLDFENVRLLKSTMATSIDKLIEQYGAAEKLADAIINGNPEVDIEKVGRRVKGVRKIYLNDSDKIAYRVSRQDVVYTSNGEEKEVKAFVETESNVNVDIPLRWTGKLIPKEKAVRTFVFLRKYQIRHVNGLTFDFLYDMAKQLHEKNSLMLIGSGSKGIDPLVFSKGGTSYRAFLEGRVDGDKYCLILHLTNLELKNV